MWILFCIFNNLIFGENLLLNVYIMLVAITAADSIINVVYMRINILPVQNWTSKLSNSDVYLCASELYWCIGVKLTWYCMTVQLHYVLISWVVSFEMILSLHYYRFSYCPGDVMSLVCPIILHFKWKNGLGLLFYSTPILNVECIFLTYFLVYHLDQMKKYYSSLMWNSIL